MKRLFSAAAASLLACSILVGCSDGSGGEPQPVEELNIVVMSETAHFDQHVLNLEVSKAVARHFFETLVTLNSKREVVPMLAESFEEADGGATYVFHLRENVPFHNGEIMDAEDVVASMARWARLAAVPPVVKEAEWVATDDMTVEMRLPYPSAIAITALAKSAQFPAIMPVELLEEAGDEPVAEYVGTGPYMFSEWRSGQYVELVKFDDYAALDTPADGLGGKKVALAETLRFHFVSDPATQLAGVTTGEYDVVHQITHDYYSRLESDPNVKTVIGSFGMLQVLYNRHPESVFNDIRVRQAVNAALDPEGILAAVYPPAFIEMDSGYAPPDDSIWHSNAGSEFYNQKNLELAKQLLEEAGYAGEPVVILTTQDNQRNYNTSLVIQEQLKAIGMEVVLDVYDQATVLERRRDPNLWDLYPATFGWADTPLNMTFMNPSFIGGPFDEKIMGLREEISKASSLDEARVAWEELQGYLWEYLVSTKIGNENALVALGAGVEGFTYLDGPILWNTTRVE